MQALTTVADIDAAERQLDVRLPEQFNAFLREFGGGHFAFTWIYSATSTSKDGLVDANPKSGRYPVAFLAVADDGTGNSYGFRIRPDRTCEPLVSYHDFEFSEITGTGPDFFEFVVHHGLNH